MNVCDGAIHMLEICPHHVNTSLSFITGCLSTGLRQTLGPGRPTGTELVHIVDIAVSRGGEAEAPYFTFLMRMISNAARSTTMIAVGKIHM